MQQPSLVEMFYASLASKMGIFLQWNQLNMMEQNEFTEGVSRILSVMHSAQQAQAGE